MITYTCRCCSARSATRRTGERSVAMSELIWNRYGKSRIRLVKVRRPSTLREPQGRPEPGRGATGTGQARVPHELVDLTIDVQLEGEFDAVYVDGDNASCLATDTMKNTVYALARQEPVDHAEAFALTLADHFAGNPAVTGVRISMIEQPWGRLSSGGQ